MATVRGTFDLNARPATTALQGLRRELATTDRSVKSLGSSIDRMISADNLAQLEAYRNRLGEINDELYQLTLGARTAETRLNSLGRVRATPRVELGGVAQALQQIELLHQRINALGRERAIARVGAGRGLAGRVAQPGIPSGLAAGLAERATAQGPGNVPATAARGIIGISQGPINVGMLGATSLPAKVAGGIMLPSYLSLAQAAPAVVPLAGTVAGGAAGAGAVGAAGLGVLGSAITSLATIAVPTAKALTMASSAQQSLTSAVNTYGANSKEAATATERLNTVLAGTPGLAKLWEAKTAMSERYARVTAPGRQDLMAMMTGGMRTAGALAPTIGGQANRFFAAARPAASNFEQFLQGQGATRFFRVAGGMAAGNVDELEQMLENVTATLMHLTRAARPFFNEAMDWLVDWTRGWRSSTSDIGSTRDWIEKMLRDWRQWGDLTHATFKLLWDLMMADRPAGRSMLADLTDQMNEWDKWVNRHPGQVRQFFDDAVGSAKQLADTLGNIVGFLKQMMDLLDPILDLMGNLANTVSALPPGMALPAMIGGYYGLKAMKGRATGAVPAPAGAAPGMMPVPVGGAPRAPVPVGGVRNAGTMYGVARSTGMGRFASLSQAGQELFAGGAGARVGSFAGAAGRYMGWTALAMGALQGLGYPGNVQQRMTAGLSGATFGAIPMPTGGYADRFSGVQGAFRNMTAASPLLTGLKGGGVGDIAQSIGLAATAPITAIPLMGLGALGIHPFGIGGPSAEEQRFERSQGRVQNLGRKTPETTREFLDLANAADRAAKRAAEVGADPATIQNLKDIADQSHKTARALKRDFGEKQFGDITRMYSALVKGGKSAEQAFTIVSKDIVGKVEKLRGEGQDKFLAMTNAWVKDFKRAHPQLVDEVRAQQREIVRELRQSGEKVALINGRIVEVNDKTWKKVKDSIITQSELARRGADNNLSAIMRQAVGFLEQMGWSPGAAQQIAKWTAMSPSQRHQAGQQAQSHVQHHHPQWAQAYGGRARAGGGRAQGSYVYGAQDHVQMPNGDVVGGGELWVNRHTEGRVDRMLAAFGTTLDREVRGETRAHSAQLPSGFTADRRFGGRRFAAGGRGGGGGSIRAAATLAERMGLSVSEGPGYGAIPTSGHASGSLHYSGLAYDVSGAADAMRRYFFAAYHAFRNQINELFYDPIGWYVDQGNKVSGAIGGHSDHVHIGFFGGAALKGAGAGGMGIELMKPLSPLQTKAGGWLAAGVNQGNQRAADALREHVNKELRRRGGGAGYAGGGSMSEAQIQQLARSVGMPNPHLMAAIAMAESGGNVRAHNPSGASGLWQIMMPANQSYVHGNVYNPRVNAEAALAILRAQGLSAWEAYTNGAYRQYMAFGGRARWGGWHAGGGSFMARGPTVFGAGERGDEEVTITPRRKPGGGGKQLIVHNHFGNVNVRDEKDIDRLADAIGDKLEAALRKTDGVSEGRPT